MSYARPVAARSSIAWTFDETRATMQELRRQLQIEKEVSRDAERERDELARELSGMRAEQAARSEVQQALEAQRDAAAARASSAEGRATRADAALGRQSQEFAAIDADLAAREREIEQNAERVKLEADARVAAAERDKAEAEAELLALRDEAAALRARVAQLEKVKITSGLAAKIQKVVQERDELLAAARKGGRFNERTRRPSAPRTSPRPAASAASPRRPLPRISVTPPYAYSLHFERPRRRRRAALAIRDS